jgi:hypothetical protein
MKKWLIVILLAIVFMVVMCVSGIVRGEENGFPYKTWRIVSVKLMPDGMFYIVFANPDPTDEIRAVVIILVPVAEVPLREKPPPQNKGLGVAF